MSKITVELHSVTVRRDAQTITPVTVPEYEIPVLRNLFGKENITVNEVVRMIDVEPEGEYERLCAKYGFELIAKIFGEDDGLRLAEIVQKSEVDAPVEGREKHLTKAERAAAAKAEKEAATQD
jgi:hypothetical protein